MGAEPDTGYVAKWHEDTRGSFRRQPEHAFVFSFIAYDTTGGSDFALVDRSKASPFRGERRSKNARFHDKRPFERRLRFAFALTYRAVR